MARVLLAAEAEPASNRVGARLALEGAGHTVDEVHDGQSALAHAEATRPDVLVLDTALPVLDGFQVLDRLRRHHALRQLPVVMLSSIPRSLGGELSRSMGAIRYLVKPLTVADLAEAVEVAVAGRAPAAAPTGVRSAAEWRARAAVPDTSDLFELAAPAQRRASVPRRPPRGSSASVLGR